MTQFKLLLLCIFLLSYNESRSQNRVQSWEVQAGFVVQQKFRIDEPVKTAIIASQAKSITPIIKLSYDKTIKKHFYGGVAISFTQIVGSTNSNDFDSFPKSNFTTPIAPLLQIQARFSYRYIFKKNIIFGMAGLGVTKIFLPEASGRKITILQPPRAGDFLEIKDYLIREGSQTKQWKPGTPIFVDLTFGYKYALGKHISIGASFGKILSFSPIYNGVYEVKVGYNISTGNVSSSINAQVYSLLLTLYY